jgi:hypothetical protein
VSRAVVVELGAGEAVPTVRRLGERLARNRLIRINARDADTPAHHGLGLHGCALELLAALDSAV